MYPERQAGRNGDAAESIEAVVTTRLGKFAEADQIGQRNELAAAAGAHVQIVEIRRFRTITTLSLHDDVVLLATIDVGGDEAPAHHGFEGATDFLRRHAKVRGTHMVDVDAHLRLGFLVVGIRADQAGILVHALDHAITPLRNLLIVRSAQYHAQWLAAAA